MSEEAPDVPLSDWATGGTAEDLVLHGTAVAFDGAAVVFLGASGSGKSALALALMGQGARLICDDGIRILGRGPQMIARRPDSATDLIEARGLGLLSGGPICTEAPVALVVDLDRAEPLRLPPGRRVRMGRRNAPLILGAGMSLLADALLHMLRHGRAVPPPHDPRPADAD